MKPKYKNYVFEYYHDGSNWGLTIPARSEEDAMARVKQIYYAKLLGIQVMKIPVRVGVFARLACWLRNKWYHRFAASEGQ